MGCRASTMRKQCDGPLSHDLHMPAIAGRVDEAACVAIGPIRAVGTPGQFGTHRAVIQLKELARDVSLCGCAVRSSRRHTVQKGFVKSDEFPWFLEMRHGAGLKHV